MSKFANDMLYGRRLPASLQWSETLNVEKPKSQTKSEMMDSQENTLKQGAEEVKLSEEVVTNASKDNSEEAQETNTKAAEDLKQPVETQPESEETNPAAKAYSSKRNHRASKGYRRQ